MLQRSGQQPPALDIAAFVLYNGDSPRQWSEHSIPDGELFFHSCFGVYTELSYKNQKVALASLDLTE